MERIGGYTVICFHIKFKWKLCIEFGAFVKTNKEHEKIMKSKTIGDITLIPTVNAQGGKYLLSLCTGR